MTLQLRLDGLRKEMIILMPQCVCVQMLISISEDGATVSFRGRTRVC